jgi:integrase
LIGYRDERFKVLTQYKRKRTLASWNREAAVLRRIFSVGCQQDWLDKNPFRRGDSLIIISAERRREKILTVSEEARLLAACDSHPYRKPLKALLIFLIDSGCRKGEALQLRFRSVSFATRLVTLEGTTTKTLKTRQVMMTSRVFQQLMTLWEASTKEPNARVFGITDNVRKSFASVCKIAGIKHGGVDGLTLHSLRHTAASRLVAGGMSIELAGKLLGHSPRTNTTYKWYLSADVETAVRAVEILESFQPDQGHTYDVETPDAAPYQVQQIEGVQ